MFWGLVFFCFSAVANAAATSAPTHFLEVFYQQALQQSGQSVFLVDTQKSHALIYVYSDGLLSSLGHNHIVASHNLQGYASLDQNTQIFKADLFMPIGELTVDEVALRKLAPFDSQPSIEDIAGTRQHMLESVLEEKHFPFVTVHVEAWSPFRSPQEVQVVLTLHGVQRNIAVPVKMVFTREKTVMVSGHFSLQQRDYGMAPYSVLGGLLQVRDRVDIEFTLVANQLTGK